MTENPQSLKVSLEDLAEVANSEPDKVSVQAQPASLSPAGKSYGNVNTAPDVPAIAQEKGSILLQGWFYLGVAGTLGSLAGWGIAEPGFVDGPRNGSHWGDVLMVPLVVTLMCVGFAVAESIVERSTRKALIRGGLALPLGMVLGFLIANLANVFYSVGLSICRAAGVLTFHNPATWIVRGLAWMVLGAAGGIIYGIIGQSMKKTGYGALGGAIGALLGGTVFDPISFATHGGAASRAVGFGLLGMATGIAIGLVESALKDRWLHVTAGPLAGKQFILYKPRTVVGSAQSSDIYLFKDPDVLPVHAVLELKGSKIYLVPSGPVFISGQPMRGPRVIETGTTVQIGRYGFRYQERHRG
ncbi:MAG TPA: FHA domain-containing protein [Acidobacteriaceae bacterium]